MVLLYVNEILDEPLMTYSVIGHQWYWEYASIGESYISYIIRGVRDFRVLGVDNRLVFPAFRWVGVTVTSADVIHS